MMTVDRRAAVNLNKCQERSKGIACKNLTGLIPQEDVKE